MNAAHDRMHATARPPGSGALSAVRMFTIRSAIEPRVMTFPHRMKSGIARMTSLSMPRHMSSMM